MKGLFEYEEEEDFKSSLLRRVGLFLLGAVVLIAVIFVYFHLETITTRLVQGFAAALLLAIVWGFTLQPRGGWGTILLYPMTDTSEPLIFQGEDIGARYPQHLTFKLTLRRIWPLAIPIAILGTFEIVQFAAPGLHPLHQIADSTWPMLIAVRVVLPVCTLIVGVWLHERVLLKRGTLAFCRVRQYTENTFAIELQSMDGVYADALYAPRWWHQKLSGNCALVLTGTVDSEIHLPMNALFFHCLTLVDRTHADFPEEDCSESAPQAGEEGVVK